MFFSPGDSFSCFFLHWPFSFMTFFFFEREAEIRAWGCTLLSLNFVRGNNWAYSIATPQLSLWSTARCCAECVQVLTHSKKTMHVLNDLNAQYDFAINQKQQEINRHGLRSNSKQVNEITGNRPKTRRGGDRSKTNTNRKENLCHYTGMIKQHII